MGERVVGSVAVRGWRLCLSQRRNRMMEWRETAAMAASIKTELAMHEVHVSSLKRGSHGTRLHEVANAESRR